MIKGRIGGFASKIAGPLAWEGLLNLFVVYVVWGSTYLAIRIAVHEGSGFPPFLMAAGRTFIGGLLLLLWAKSKGEKLKLERKDALLLAMTGALLWIGGNGMVNWAEQRIHSALAALLVATTPLWVAALESLIERRPPSLLLAGSLLLGFCGTGFLSYPVLAGGVHADMLSIVALFFASLCWGGGSLLQRRRGIHLSARVTAGYQQIFVLPGFLLLSYLTGEPAPAPLASAWLAFAYLVVFGSVIAIASFTRALQILPTKVLFTYGYVNPMIALFLGWIVLSEPITSWTLLGALLIVSGVAGVFQESRAGHRLKKDDVR
ncbi:MAG: EamA family transporter [Ignavibacteriae bacterium]|nr:MAG: EamA family transporter [Ignavibacteriota bacterium]